MKKLSIGGYSFSLANLLFMFWLILLTSFTVFNLAVSNQNQHFEKFAELDNKFQQLLAQMTVYTEQFDNLLHDPLVNQSQLTDVQQELRERIQTVSEQLSLVIDKDEIIALQEQLTSNSKQINKVETDLASLVTQFNSFNNSPPKTQSIKKANVSYSPPFKALSVEMRGGEQKLVILPYGQKSLDAVQLISAGQSYGNWQLQSFNQKTAEFRVGSKTRHINISK